MTVHNDFDYQILRLSEDFYRAYPNPPYIEILKKQHRSGLDYSKLVIIRNPEYIEKEEAVVVQSPNLC